MILFGKEITYKIPPLFIAEISCNHKGSIDEAKELIHAAKEAGADAVKIQTYTADELTDKSVQYRIKDGPWTDRSLYELYCQTATPYEWIPDLFGEAARAGIPIFSSVFGDAGLSVLEINNCPAYKIASFEANDINLIEKVAKTNKPLLISIGTLSPQEVYRVSNLVNHKNTCLMHCVSKYPHNFEEANLNKFTFLKGFYEIMLGYSDHCAEWHGMMLAIGLGAKIIEKHVTLEEDTEDKTVNITMDEFVYYKKFGLEAWEAIQYKSHVEDESMQFRRSLYIVKDIKEGELITKENIRSIRPGHGAEPYHYASLLGKKASKDLEAGTPLKLECVKYD